MLLKWWTKRRVVNQVEVPIGIGDGEERERAKYVWMFGPRREGDEELKKKYPELRKDYS